MWQVAPCGGTLGMRRALQCGGGTQTGVDGVTQLVLLPLEGALG